MLGVIMLNVIMLSVMAPFDPLPRIAGSNRDDLFPLKPHFALVTNGAIAL